MNRPLNIMELPREILEKILSFLTYDEIAKKREVCRKFNTICGKMLNRGFVQMEKKHAFIFKNVKTHLPRRESERRVHQLARHCDILSAIETRINMLDMTFIKYIDAGACCFIPGKVLDEIMKILDLVSSTNTPPRTHEVLQELRDISSMAMEYFDEKIAPGLKIINHLPAFALPGNRKCFTNRKTIKCASCSLNNYNMMMRDNLRKEIHSYHNKTTRHGQVINVLKSLVTKLSGKVKRQNQVITNQSTKLREQSAKIKEQATSIAELKRHMEEWDLKFADLAAGINRSREETTQNTVTTPTIPQPPPSTSTIRPTSYSPPRFYKSNIKPRMAQVVPRSVIINQYLEGERKRKAENLLRNPAAPIPAKISRISNRIEDDSNKDDVRGIVNRHNDTMFSSLPLFLSSSLEMLIKSPITSLKSRKRKL